MFTEEIPMKKSKFSDSQIVGYIKRAEAGEAVPALCREAGVSSATFYKWRIKYGGVDASLMGRADATFGRHRIQIWQLRSNS